MKNNNNSSLNFVSYLDVSEYIIKEPSPLLQPSPLPHQHHETLSPEDNFELEPIEVNHSEIVLTPITSGLIRLEVQDFMDDFMLESEDYLWSHDEHDSPRKTAGRRKLCKKSTFELFKLENDLDQIVEYDQEESYPSEFYDSYCSEGEKAFEEDQCGANSNTMCTSWLKKSEPKEQSSKDIQLQYQTTVDISNVDYSQSIQNFSKNPKLEILSKIKEIEQLGLSADLEEKKFLIKKHLENYLIDYEVHCYEEAWKELDQLRNPFALIREGIEEIFSKKVGSLSFQNRRVKLLKYLEKKKRRIWKKKVSYDCRKKVADGRLRIKGKFVTRAQACEQLGLESLDNYSAEEIKEMLQRRIDENLKQMMFC